MNKEEVKDMTSLEKVNELLKRRFPDAVSVDTEVTHEGMDTHVDYQTGYKKDEVLRTLSGEPARKSTEEEE